MMPNVIPKVIIRHFDAFGRVIVPPVTRRKLNIKENDSYVMYIDYDGNTPIICLTKAPTSSEEIKKFNFNRGHRKPY